MKNISSPIRRIRVNSFTNGTIGPNLTVPGPVEDGGTIEVVTAPGCWGPMITPRFKCGHEVNQPVAVAGAITNSYSIY